MSFFSKKQIKNRIQNKIVELINELFSADFQLNIPTMRILVHVQNLSKKNKVPVIVVPIEELGEKVEKLLKSTIKRYQIIVCYGNHFSCLDLIIENKKGRAILLDAANHYSQKYILETLERNADIECIYYAGYYGEYPSKYNLHSIQKDTFNCGIFSLSHMQEMQNIDLHCILNDLTEKDTLIKPTLTLFDNLFGCKGKKISLDWFNFPPQIVQYNQSGTTWEAYKQNYLERFNLSSEYFAPFDEYREKMIKIGYCSGNTMQGNVIPGKRKSLIDAYLNDLELSLNDEVSQIVLHIVEDPILLNNTQFIAAILRVVEHSEIQVNITNYFRRMEEILKQDTLSVYQKIDYLLTSDDDSRQKLNAFSFMAYFARIISGFSLNIKTAVENASKDKKEEACSTVTGNALSKLATIEQYLLSSKDSQCGTELAQLISMDQSYLMEHIVAMIRENAWAGGAIVAAVEQIHIKEVIDIVLCEQLEGQSYTILLGKLQLNDNDKVEDYVTLAMHLFYQNAPAAVSLLFHKIDEAGPHFPCNQEMVRQTVLQRIDEAQDRYNLVLHILRSTAWNDLFLYPNINNFLSYCIDRNFSLENVLRSPFFQRYISFSDFQICISLVTAAPQLSDKEKLLYLEGLGEINFQFKIQEIITLELVVATLSSFPVIGDKLISLSKIDSIERFAQLCDAVEHNGLDTHILKQHEVQFIDAAHYKKFLALLLQLRANQSYDYYREQFYFRFPLLESFQYQALNAKNIDLVLTGLEERFVEELFQKYCGVDDFSEFDALEKKQLQCLILLGYSRPDVTFYVTDYFVTRCHKSTYLYYIKKYLPNYVSPILQALPQDKKYSWISSYLNAKAILGTLSEFKELILYLNDDPTDDDPTGHEVLFAMIQKYAPFLSAAIWGEWGVMEFASDGTCYEYYNPSDISALLSTCPGHTHAILEVLLEITQGKLLRFFTEEDIDENYFSFLQLETEYEKNTELLAIIIKKYKDSFEEHISCFKYFYRLVGINNYRAIQFLMENHASVLAGFITDPERMDTIVFHFATSMERVQQLFDFFYQNNKDTLTIYFRERLIPLKLYCQLQDRFILPERVKLFKYFFFMAKQLEIDTTWLWDSLDYSHLLKEQKLTVLLAYIETCPARTDLEHVFSTYRINTPSHLFWQNTHCSQVSAKVAAALRNTNFYTDNEVAELTQIMTEPRNFSHFQITCG